LNVQTLLTRGALSKESLFLIDQTMHASSD
jgi:hypothetical protein